MKRSHDGILHVALFLLAVAGCAWAAHDSVLSLMWSVQGRQGVDGNRAPRAGAPLRDATGSMVAPGEYRRIITTDGIDIVLDLVPADRIIATDAWSVRYNAQGWRVAGRPTFSSLTDTESIVAMAPDLVITCTQGDPQMRQDMTRLREAGIAVYDVGYVVTAADLLERISCLGILLGQPERAAVLRASYADRVALTMRLVPWNQRPSAVHGNGVDGRLVVDGAIADCFHEMLMGAGFRDKVIEGGCPAELGTEGTNALAPDIIATHVQSQKLRLLPGVDGIPAFGPHGWLLDLPLGSMASVVNPDIVTAMESLHQAVYLEPATRDRREQH